MVYVFKNYIVEVPQWLLKKLLLTSRNLGKKGLLLCDKLMYPYYIPYVPSLW